MLIGVNELGAQSRVSVYIIYGYTDVSGQSVIYTCSVCAGS